MALMQRNATTAVARSPAQPRAAQPRPAAARPPPPPPEPASAPAPAPGPLHVGAAAKPAEPAPAPAPTPESKPADVGAAAEPEDPKPAPEPAGDEARLAEGVAASLQQADKEEISAVDSEQVEAAAAVAAVAALDSEQVEAAAAVAAVAAFEADGSLLDHLRADQRYKRALAVQLVKLWKDAYIHAYNFEGQLAEANRQANVSDGLVEEEERRVRALALEKAGAMPDVESP
jgi:hypothetical protein